MGVFISTDARLRVHEDHGCHGVARGQFGKGKGDDRDAEQAGRHLNNAAEDVSIQRRV
jgi:hypothetical protein